MQKTQTHQKATTSKQKCQEEFPSDETKTPKLENFQELIYKYIEDGNQVEDHYLYNELARIFDVVSTFGQAQKVIRDWQENKQSEEEFYGSLSAIIGRGLLIRKLVSGQPENS